MDDSLRENHELRMWTSNLWVRGWKCFLGSLLPKCVQKVSHLSPLKTVHEEKSPAGTLVLLSGYCLKIHGVISEIADTQVSKEAIVS